MGVKGEVLEGRVVGLMGQRNLPGTRPAARGEWRAGRGEGGGTQARSLRRTSLN
jgi:hypothetical protein